MTAAFKPIFTQAGLSAAARAQAGNRSLSITHVALGRGKYTPVGTETALRQERDRVAIDRSAHVEEGTWQVLARISGSETYFANEVGFYADDQGTPVLLLVYSSEDTTFAAVTEGQETLIDLHLSLAQLPNGLVNIRMLDTDLMEQDVLDDLSGEHNLDGDFNFALTRNLEHWQGQSAEAVEAAADVYRSMGQSGILMGRQYNLGGDASYHRPSAVSFAAFGVHDHPNYPFMSGLPELHAAVNGYRVNMRHVDYRWYRPVGGAYLAVDEPTPPAVPASVTAQATPEAQVDEMREYLRAYALKDPGIRDYRDHFDVYLSYLEVWFEEFKGDTLHDTAHSFRHQLDSDSLKEMIQKYIVLNASGLKPRFENSSFMPGLIRSVDRNGRPQFSILRYRVGAVRVGSYRDYPVHEMVEQVDDPATRMRKGQTDEELAEGRLGRFRVKHSIADGNLAERTDPGQLDALMSMIPGLDGDGAVIREEYLDTHAHGGTFTQRLMKYKTSDQLNSAYYNRFYSYEHAGAAGRRNYRRGFNDPTLFVATNTKTEVTAVPGMGGEHRLSWAVPLELMVTGPIAGWNPYGVAEVQPITGTGATAGAALNGVRQNGDWYMCPASLFDGETVVADQADTSKAKWVNDGTNTPRLMAGSGVYVFLPRIDNAAPMRMRYPIAPVHHEGSFTFGHAEAVRAEVNQALAAMTLQIDELKHTVHGGPDVG
jgi:hypothetical protein